MIKYCLVLCLPLLLAGFLHGAEKSGTLTVQEAAELVEKANASNGKQSQLDLKWLTSIDRDVARELSYYKGQRIYLDGLTSISKEVANELTTQRPGWYYWPDTKIPQKGISLDGLTSITKDVARELAKCTGDLNLNYVNSMDSEVARELAKFQGSFLNIQKLESIAPEDMNILKDGLRRPGSENSYRSMMPYKLKDGTRLKKWNGKIIEYRKDGSKIREIDYQYGGVILRMEWDEAGNLVKEETYPVHKPRGVDVDEQYKSPDWLSNVQLSGTFRLRGKGFASLVTPVGNFWVEEGKFSSGYKLIELDTSKSQPSALIQKGDQQAWVGLRLGMPVEMTDFDKENPDYDLTFDNERYAPERKHPYDDLTFREGANKERIAYAKDEDEPFTGVGVSPKRKGSLGWESRFLNGKLHGKKTLFNNDGSILSDQPYLNGKLHGLSVSWSSAAAGRLNWEKQHINGKQISDKRYFRSGSVRTETSFKGGKPVLKSTWDKDGNLIESETF